MASPTSKLLSSSSSRHSSCHHRTKRGPMTSFDVLHHETSHLTLKHPATSPSKRGRGEKKHVASSCHRNSRAPLTPPIKREIAAQPKFRFLVVNPSEMAARLFLHQFFHIFSIHFSVIFPSFSFPFHRKHIDTSSPGGSWPSCDGSLHQNSSGCSKNSLPQ